MSTLIASDYLEAKILNFILRNEDFASPASVYLALYTATPNDAGGGTPVSGGSYARKQLTGAFDTAANGATANTAEIAFPTATADWGLVTSVGIFDDPTAGNLLFYGDLTSSKQVDNGDVFSIAAGDLDISFTGDIGYYLANKLLDHILDGASFTKPTAAYVALYITLPNAGDTGGTEVSGTSYARQSCWGSTNWDAPTATGGDTENTNIVTFGAAGSNWGTVTGMAIRTADTGGSLLFFKALGANKTVNSGDTFRFSAGAIDIVVG